VNSDTDTETEVSATNIENTDVVKMNTSPEFPSVKQPEPDGFSCQCVLVRLCSDRQNIIQLMNVVKFCHKVKGFSIKIIQISILLVLTLRWL
jgi:hypothetical protein